MKQRKRKHEEAMQKMREYEFSQNLSFINTCIIFTARGSSTIASLIPYTFKTKHPKTSKQEA